MKEMDGTWKEAKSELERRKGVEFNNRREASSPVDPRRDIELASP